MTLVTRRYAFAASHRLHSPALSPDENFRVFGKCNNPHGHGHNYRLHVTVEGEIDAGTGVVVPVAALDRLVETRVLNRLEHANLNADIPEFENGIPTTENLGTQIALWLFDGWQELKPARLRQIRLEETASNVIEVDFS
jgi:6-pyruvoyltetrahydropterin/6-carboxytetrahydropterin synthase